jgi:UDPglucose 6-dehydrogenase
MWGLAFKPNTDDMREAPSRVVIAELVRRGALVQVYDPVAAAEARRVLALDLGPEALAQVRFASSAPAAVSGAHALVIVTEWKEFRTPDFESLATALADRRIFDGRNLYDPALVRGFGLDYRSIGRR